MTAVVYVSANGETSLREHGCAGAVCRVPLCPNAEPMHPFLRPLGRLPNVPCIECYVQTLTTGRRVNCPHTEDHD